MIKEILKDYTVSDFDEFVKKSPSAYERLCAIIGEFELGVRSVNLAITLPLIESKDGILSCEDRGCVAVCVITGDIFEIIDTRYF